MEPSPDDPLPQAELYERHFPRLLALAISEYHIPASRAELLVHDLLLAQLLRPNLPADVESWLNGALKTAARRLSEVP